MRISVPTNNINRPFLSFVGLALLFLGQSCNRPFATPITSPIPPPTFTEEPEEFSDCRWIATGKSWNDDNQDGDWDSSEKPLAGVNFWVDDTLNDYHKVNEFLADTVASNADGIVEIAVWLPGCPDVEFEIYTEAPQNCKLTTPERISANVNSRNSVYSFGFVCE